MTIRPTTRKLALARGLAEGLDRRLSEQIHQEIVDAADRETTPALLAEALLKKSSDAITKQIRVPTDSDEPKQPAQARLFALLRELAPRSFVRTMDVFAAELGIRWHFAESAEPSVEDLRLLISSALERAAAATSHALRDAADGQVDELDTTRPMILDAIRQLQTLLVTLEAAAVPRPDPHQAWLAANTPANGRARV